MGTFGRQFIVATDLQAAPVGVIGADAVAAASHNTDRLQAAINTAHARGGGYVQILPGRFLLGRRGGVRPLDPEASIDGGDLLVHEDVILWFMPGAVLVPLGNALAGPRDPLRTSRIGDDEGVCIELQGGIRAPRAPIFDTMVDATHEAGLVIFAGDQVREIVPEWWGASSNDVDHSMPADPVARAAAMARTAAAVAANRRGLQAALDASHRNRVRILRDVDGVAQTDGPSRVRRWERTAIPVRLTGKYEIDQELVVGSAEDGVSRPVNRSGFILRGELGVGGTGAGRPSFIATDRSVPGLLRIHHISGFRVEGVTFDANGAKRTVRVEYVDGDGAESVFEGCGFLNATRALLEVTGQNFSVADAVAPCLLSFRRCRMEPMPPPRAQELGLLHDETQGPHVGVLLDTRESVLVELRNCFLTGSADPLVLARSGWFSLRECTTHTHRHRDPRGIGAANGEPSTRNGTDLYIDTPTELNSRGLLEPASFTVREYECQSWQCVGTFPGSAVIAPRVARTTSLIVNLNHSNALEVSPATIGLHDQPAIFWDGPARTGADLILMGALITPRLDRILDTATAWHTGTHGGYIHVAAENRGRVFDLGIAARGNSEPLESGGSGSTVVFGTDSGISSMLVYRVPQFVSHP